CLSPLNVRFADTPKDKEVRKMQQKLNESFLQQIANNTSSITKETNEDLTSLNLMLFNRLYSNNINDLSCGDNNHNGLASKLIKHQQNNLFETNTNTTSIFYSGDQSKEQQQQQQQHLTNSKGHSLRLPVIMNLLLS
ncbi:unnamed protein product, partial [Rotaria socialis]